MIGTMDTGIGSQQECVSYKCDQCEKEFPTKLRLSAHVVIHTGEKPYKCEFCEKCFNNCGTYNRHKKNHILGDQRPFQCEVCKKTYKTKEVLEKHFKTIHATYNQVSCELCERKFPNTTILKQHIKTHSKER